MCLIHLQFDSSSRLSLANEDRSKMISVKAKISKIMHKIMSGSLT